MKKFALCCLAFAVLALLVPTASAGTVCYHLTYFCDIVQATGPQSGEDAGLWDWVCANNGHGQIDIGPHHKFGTYPLYPFNTGSPGGFAANFKFIPATLRFNLYGTFDGSSVFFFQQNSPYTVTGGPCPLAPKPNNLRPATVR